MQNYPCHPPACIEEKPHKKQRHGYLFRGQQGSVAQMVWRCGFSYPRADLFHDLCNGRSERGEAVQDGNTNLELRDLTVEVPRHEALTQ